MQLGCTKKLQEFLKKDILLADQCIDPFYIWNASIMLVNRRKTIVVLHSQSRCGFVLHGITVRDIRELDRLILDGIRDMLAAHGICAAVIGQYLDECGRISYTTTQDQTAVAHLNYFCEQVGFFSEAFIPIKQFQTHLLQSLNEDSVKFDEEYIDLRQKLRDSFSEHYPGQSVLFQKMAVLDIKLVNAPCFRRLCIPSHYSLMKLHWAIQILFSWKDAHLHVFETEDGLSLDFDFPEYSFLVSEYPRMIGSSRLKRKWNAIFPLVKCLNTAGPSNTSMIPSGTGCTESHLQPGRTMHKTAKQAAFWHPVWLLWKMWTVWADVRTEIP